MSRVGKKPIKILSGVTAQINGQRISVKGPKGELSLDAHPHVNLNLEGDTLNLTVRDSENVGDKALWGLTARLITNMIIGVTTGFSKKLEINGVGYKAAINGSVLKLDVGFSHEVNFAIPKGLVMIVEKNVITITGIDKQLVGEIASQIRRIRKPEPYKGKGIKYSDEVIRRKAGKAAKTGSAA